MRISRKFISERFDGHGYLGWMPIGLDGAYPGTGLTVAHDAMEHISHAPDPVTDEIAAIGAIFMLRFDNGWRGSESQYLSHTDIGREITTVITNCLINDDLYLTLPSYEAKISSEQIHELEICVDDALTRLDAEMAFEDNDLIHERLRHAHPRKELKRRILSWMKFGCDKADAAYSTMGYLRAHDIFNEIQKTSDQLLFDCDGMSGITMRIDIDLDTGDLTISHNLRDGVDDDENEHTLSFQNQAIVRHLLGLAA